jgi:peptidoglycan/LPS O-acetylase OafA/YrhL
MTSMAAPFISKPSSERTYFPALDGLRGIAILAVLLVQSVPPLAGAGNGVRAINSFFHLGVLGVDFFFVLSGFLITGTLLDSKPGPDFFRSFYIRRFLRYFPFVTDSWLSWRP